MKNSKKEIEIILDYNFKNSDLLKTSLIHKSFDNLNNNEKLEFLGDRVLGLIISKRLIEIYPEEREGIIDKKFANLVNKKTCSNIANKLDIKRLSIETGAGDFFIPARKLFKSCGFEPCEPFAHYKEDPNSCYCSLNI